jgi:anaerobic magnesium-protoporphyrin IX monomethyl ester cyclase
VAQSKRAIKMNLLLIYPGLVEGFSSYDKGSNWFNHGVGIISAVLKNDGHQIEYLDCRKLGGWEQVVERIQNIDFSMALISVATVDFEPAQKIARIIKEKNSNLKTMVGGPHPTLMTKQTEEIKDFDYIFTHEAEITLPILLRNYPNIPRVTRGEMPTDLDTLPFVDRTLACKGETSWFSGLKSPYFSVTASRGCLYKCTFCQPAEREVFGNKVRKRSVDNILDEIEYLAQEYKMQSFMIHDDCFTQYYSWVEEFCEKKERRGLKQPFVCQSRADIICSRPDLMKKLVDVGLKWVLIGFESGSDRILKFIDKGTTVEQNILAGNLCKEMGIKIFANYMFGLPTETKEEMQQTAEMIQRIKPDICSPAVFTPAPGSDLYSYCIDHNLNLITSSDGYRRSVNSGAKIRGVDYDFINKMIAKSMKRSFIERKKIKLNAYKDKLLRSADSLKRHLFSE